jgi:C-terminal processing protease CtpA/Prc
VSTIRTIATITLALAALAAAVPAAAQRPEELARQAYEAYTRKDYARSADLYAALVRAGDSDPNTFYNAACANALAGRADTAFDMLERAVAAGFIDAENVKKDPDLASLHADARWAPLVARIEKAARARDALWNNPAIATPYRETLPEDERIAGLSRLWSEVKFNFAYFDLVPDLDWDALYLAYLPRVRQTPSTLEYYRLLAEMAARLRDGHTGVYVPKELYDEVYARPAFSTLLVEDRVLVTRVYDDALRRGGVVPGAEVVEIDGVAVKRYAEERVAPYQSASTPHDLAARVYGYFLFAGPASKTVEVTFRSAGGETFTRRIARLPFEQGRKVANPPAMELRMLPGNVAYVALNSFNDDSAAEQFEARFDEIAKADALVLDVRENGGGNSDVGYRVLACLTDKPFKTSRWQTRDYRPTFRAWGRGEAVYTEEAGEVQPSGSRLFSKPVVVLTSARTYSAAEDFVVAFDAMKRGAIVGEPTGGSTGQPLNFALPGGGGARVCTKRDTYPDGRAFVGVGVQPQTLVRPTVDDVRAGRDTVLEAALDVVRRRARVLASFP